MKPLLNSALPCLLRCLRRRETESRNRNFDKKLLDRKSLEGKSSCETLKFLYWTGVKGSRSEVPANRPDAPVALPRLPFALKKLTLSLVKPGGPPVCLYQILREAISQVGRTSICVGSLANVRLFFIRWMRAARASELFFVRCTSGTYWPVFCPLESC